MLQELTPLELFGFLAASFLVLGLLYRITIYEFFIARISQRNTRLVMKHFKTNWDGTEAGKIEAWERTVNALVTENYPEDMIIEARIHMLTEKRSQSLRRKKIKSGTKRIETTEFGTNQNPTQQ